MSATWTGVAMNRSDLHHSRLTPFACDTDSKAPVPQTWGSQPQLGGIPFEGGAGGVPV